MGCAQYRLEGSRQGVAIDLPDCRNRYAGKLTDQFNSDTAGQIPRNAGVAQRMANNLHSRIIRFQPCRLDHGFPALPCPAYGPATIFDDGMLADAETLPAPHVGEQARG